MKYDLIIFAEVFKKQRLTMKFTIDELANISGISKSSILRIERGIGIVRIDTLELLSYHLNIDMLLLLSHSKIDIDRNFHDLLSSLQYDLYRRDYSMLIIYHQKIKSLYSDYKYIDSPEGNYIFTNLEIALNWIAGLINSKVDNDMIKAEENFISALKINNESFGIYNHKNYEYSILELYVLNSIVGNRAMYNNTKDSIEILLTVKEKLERMILKDIKLYIVILINLSNQYLSIYNFNEVILLCEFSIDYCHSNRILDFNTDFNYLKNLAFYLKTKETKYLEIIKNCIIAFEIEGKLTLIPEIKKSLLTNYNINLM